jgi:uncharacterized surface protein with fasciclin (FAS1) repeats
VQVRNGIVTPLSTPHQILGISAVPRTQNQKVGKDGTLKYKSMVDCFLKILSEEGILTLWAGFTPAFIKLAPYTIISLILTEKITMLVTGKAAL